MVLHARHVNAGLGWTALVCVAVAGLVPGDPLWTGFAVVTLALAAVPVVRARDPLAMPPWELLALAALPAVVQVAIPGLGDVWQSAASYLAVAALALLLAAELHAFGDPRLSPPFAVGFVAAATMAVAAVWTMGRYASDLFLGTALLPPEDPLMTELVVATAVGVAAGFLFQYYLADVVEGLDGLAKGGTDGGDVGAGRST